MPATRRRVLRGLAGAVSVGGIATLAGCSSSCPDDDLPTPTATISMADQPMGDFDSTPAGEWIGPHATVGNTGYSSRPLPAAPLSVRWRAELDRPTTDTGGLSASAPTVREGSVLVADERRVHALSLQTGEHRWQSDAVLPTVVDALDQHRANTVAPAVGPDGDVYVGTVDGLVALDGDDGSIRWEYGGLVDVGRPAVVDEAVCAVGTETMVAIGLDGTEAWRRRVGRRGTPSPPAVAEHRIVSSMDSGIIAVDTASGEVVWDRDLTVDSQVVADAGACYVGNYDGLHALDAGSGADLWTFSRDDYRAMLSPVLTPETIYAVEQPGEAGAATFALDRGDGKPTPRWCSDIGSGAVTAASDDFALGILPLGAGQNDAHSIVAFSSDFGEAPWALRGGSHPASWLTPPAIVTDAVVVTTRGGTVVAIGGAEHA